MENNRKRNPLRAAISIQVAENVGVSRELVDKVWNGDRDNEVVMREIMRIIELWEEQCKRVMTRMVGELVTIN